MIRAAFLDAGGVLVLPHRRLVCAALAERGIEVSPAAVPRAHYRTVRALDRGRATGYLQPFSEALGVPAERVAEAVDALDRLADRASSGEILWSEPVPHSRTVMDALNRAGIVVVIVSNSDGHAAENLRDAGICQTGPGAGAPVAAVIDSEVVGSSKPDPAIFAAALEQAGTDPADTVHVGDMVSTDVAGARRVGITPVHLDPHRVCRAPDHRHVRSLRGLWQHLGRPDGP